MVRLEILLSLVVVVTNRASAGEVCSTLGNGTAISEMLGMIATPLPGNYFMLNNFASRVEHAKHPYAELLRSGDDVRPFLTRIDVLRTPGVTEDLHYLAGDAIWSWQGGCSVSYLVIKRSGIFEGKSNVTAVSWHTIGPDVEVGQTFNLVIRAGDLYAGFNSDECGTYIGVSIAPGLNMPPEIETPNVTGLKALFKDAALQEQFVDTRDGGARKSLEEFLEEYGKPDSTGGTRRLRPDGDGRGLSQGQCNVLGNSSAIAAALGMIPTPLPGNFFSLEMIGSRLDYSDHPYKELLRASERDQASVRPFLSHIQVLRTPGVTEPLHFLAGDAVWSFQAGCPVDYLVITRNATGTEGIYECEDVAWRTIGMDVESGNQDFSIMIRAGDLYAAFNSEECGTFIKTSIAPGLNMPPEIETPEASVLKGSFTRAALDKKFADTRSGGVMRTLAEFLDLYSKPDADDGEPGADDGKPGADDGKEDASSAHACGCEASALRAMPVMGILALH